MKSIAKLLTAVLLVTVAGSVSAKTAANVHSSSFDIVDRHLSGFNAVNVAGPFDVFITQGSTESVKVEAPADVIDRVLTEVNNGVLKVYSKHDRFNWGNWWGNHKKIAVYVVAKDLNAVNISGSGDVSFKNGLTTNSLKLRISGSGDMTGKINVKSLESSISGSGDMSLNGHADNSTVSLVGSGDYTARGLTTSSTAIRLTGSGDAYVNASDRIDAALHGSGDIHCSGNPKNVSKSTSGSGDIYVN
ncbi:MAG TPA: head GIN domain-containing protein [Mucilaginibacter sp.]|nr:head GIN domain-containing protein [Mucilaginibacter sp.]